MYLNIFKNTYWTVCSICDTLIAIEIGICWAMLSWIIHTSWSVPESSRWTLNWNTFETIISLRRWTTRLRNALSIERVCWRRTGTNSINVGHPRGTWSNTVWAIPLSLLTLTNRVWRIPDFSRVTSYTTKSIEVGSLWTFETYSTVPVLIRIGTCTTIQRRIPCPWTWTWNTNESIPVFASFTTTRVGSKWPDLISWTGNTTISIPIWERSRTNTMISRKDLTIFARYAGKSIEMSSWFTDTFIRLNIKNFLTWTSRNDCTWPLKQDISCLTSTSTYLTVPY